MRTLWDELNSSYVGPDYTCGDLVKFIEDQRLFQFLNRLNDSYCAVKINSLMMRSLPPISRAYSLLQQDESQKKTNSAFPSFSNVSASFFAPSSSSSVSNSGRSYNQRANSDPKRKVNSLLCRYFKKPGHIIEKYHKLYGFPPDFKFTKNKRSASCVQVDDQLSSGVQLSSISPSTSIAPSEPTSHGFSKEQYEHLMTMFQLAQISSGSPSDASPPDNTTYADFAGLFSCYAENSNGNHVCATSQSGVNPWILDSGVTNHMTPHKHLLFDIQPLPKPFLITLLMDIRLKLYPLVPYILDMISSYLCSSHANISI